MLLNGEQKTEEISSIKRTNHNRTIGKITLCAEWNKRKEMEKKINNETKYVK